LRCGVATLRQRDGQILYSKQDAGTESFPALPKICKSDPQRIKIFRRGSNAGENIHAEKNRVEQANCKFLNSFRYSKSENTLGVPVRKSQIRKFWGLSANTKSANLYKILHNSFSLTTILKVVLVRTL
jgi:hypothetical protein